MPKISFDQNFRLTKTVQYGSLWVQHLKVCNLEELRAILKFLKAHKPNEDDKPFLKMLIDMVRLKIKKEEDELEQSELEFERELKEKESEEHVELGKHGEIVSWHVDEDEDMEERYRIAMENAD
jgi:hypothetical protein